MAKGSKREAWDAVRGIGSVRFEAASGILERIVRTGGIEVSRIAARFLAERGEIGARRLARIAETGDGYRREQAIGELGRSGPPVAEELLVPLLERAEPRVRARAFEALAARNEHGRLKAATYEAMKKLRNDPDPYVRKTILKCERLYRRVADLLRETTRPTNTEAREDAATPVADDEPVR